MKAVICCMTEIGAMAITIDDAEPVRNIPYIPGAFIHWNAGQWKVTEPKTGLGIAHDPKRSMAIVLAIQLVRSRGRRDILRHIKLLSRRQRRDGLIIRQPWDNAKKEAT